MSSIVAALWKSGPSEPAVIDKMLQAAPHRGSNFCVSSIGSCSLGISNLTSAVDATISKQGSLLAAFNGYLDNAVELNLRLKDLGYLPASEKPADILVASFQAFGLDAPRHFRGAFCAVVTDGRNLWCFRDQVGFQTLFFRDEPKAFFTASEAKQIIAATGISK